MATKKNPSIYYDRGTIGSLDELDEYGIWVKSEPQDLSTVSKEGSDVQDPFIMSLNDNIDDILDDLPDYSTDLPPEDVSFDDSSSHNLDLNSDMDDFSLDLNLDSDTQDENLDVNFDIPEMEDTDSLHDINVTQDTETLKNDDFDFSLPDIDDEEQAFDDDFDLNIDFDNADDVPAAEIQEEDEEVPLTENSDDGGFSEVPMDDFLSDSPKDDAPLSAENLGEISLDDLDEENLASIDFDTDEPLIEDETLSLDDLDEKDIASINLDTDEPLIEDETLSLDDLDEKDIAPINLDTDEPLIEDETLSLDDLDEKDIASIGLDTDEPLIEDETLSLDDLDENIAPINLDDEPLIEDETLSLDDLNEKDIASINLDTDEPLIEDETLSLDDLDENIASIDFDDVAALSDDLQSPKAVAEEFGDVNLFSGTEETVTADNNTNEANRDSINIDNDIHADLPAREKSREQEKEDLSAELLQKIAGELSSIRQELSSLKAELSSVKMEVSAPTVISESVPSETPEPEEEIGAGFFDKEDDDKIALTGDELDNILNTADFTEEAGEDVHAIIEDDGIILDEEHLEIHDDAEAGVSEITFEADGFSLEEPELHDTKGISEEVPIALDNAETQEEISQEEIPDIDIPFEEESSEPDLVLDKTIIPEIDIENISHDDGAGISSDHLDILPESDISIDVPDDTIEVEESGKEISFDDIGADLPDLSVDLDDLPLDEVHDIEPDTAIDASVTPEIEDGKIAERDTEELKQLREEGAQHLVPPPPPDDISYLKDEDAGNLDLSIITDEPDVSGIAEHSVQESSAENLGVEFDDVEETPLTDNDLGIESDSEKSPVEDINIELDDVEKTPLADNDLGIELDLEDSSLAEDFELPELETEQEDELELSITELEAADDNAEELVSENEDLEQLIPEGFVVESDDSDLSLNDTESDFEGIEMIHREDNMYLSDEDSSEEDLSAPIEESMPTVRSDDFQIVNLDDYQSEDSDVSRKPVSNTSASDGIDIPQNLKQELKTVLSYMDKLLESLPEDKIEEFAKSEYFDTYKKLFEELGLV